jgi:anti-sigma regulatory factor (Ser/Thr protein kinase)
MDRPDTTRQKILAHLRAHGSSTGPELADVLGVTRQAVNPHVRDLLAQREIVKTGSTRAARYHLPGAVLEARRLEREFAIAGLDESPVYDGFVLALNLRRLPEHIEAILHYAFTEMLNNAIDHSKSERCAVVVEVDAVGARFTVRDYGIGVFHSIAEKLGHPDEHAALLELLKGKTTTQPERHSGEGIFFVSRAADRYRLRSHRIQLEWDRHKDDVFVADTRYLEGTLVEFEILRNSRTRLAAVFAAYAPREYDYRFAKTQVFVRLLQRDYVSRSEARRLLHNLDRFAEIELDLSDVRHVGQGFADEIFRVFASRHPGIVIRPTNTTPAVEAKNIRQMIPYK